LATDFEQLPQHLKLLGLYTGRCTLRQTISSKSAKQHEKNGPASGKHCRPIPTSAILAIEIGAAAPAIEGGKV